MADIEGQQRELQQRECERSGNQERDVADRAHYQSTRTST